MRASWMSLMALVLSVRVRPDRRPRPVRQPGRCPGSQGHRQAWRRSLARGVGALPPGGDCGRRSGLFWSKPPLLRSIAARASSGLVSHVWLRVSHSLGPRAPNLSRKASNSAMNRAPSGPVSRKRSTRPTTPVSKAAVSTGLAATVRPMSHIASAGTADSTSPTPEMRSAWRLRGAR